MYLILVAIKPCTGVFKDNPSSSSSSSSSSDLSYMNPVLPFHYT
uniref:Uncharacterized protein n=1 Tax=Nelumbo nucifera TaxID=4432 RepID=A0A822YLA9_NELNU|nr:TPA_asm: hypothetical protein HUJ06_005594 [Nelumbo nucifera]